MKTKATALIMKAEHPLEKTLLKALGVVLLGALACYAYFVASSIFNVIAAKEAGLESARLQTIVGGLEQEYFALAEHISPERAKTLGLAPVSQTSYVYELGVVGSAQAPRSGI